MKDHLLQQLEGAPAGRRESIAREYLQIYLLRLLHERGAATRLAFVGGTALRLLHGLPRYSEDLDFSRLEKATGRFDWETLVSSLETGLVRAGYRVAVRVRKPAHVAQAMFRFEGLPAECGLTRDPRLALSIRVEADLRPPRGARVETTLVQRFYPIALVHYDLASLFAGKLHALLARPWPKGRDWFDLVWYLTEKRGLEPNATLLENALKQTGHGPIGHGGWRARVRSRLASLDFSKVVADLRPFVERTSDLDQLSLAAIDKLLAESGQVLSAPRVASPPLPRTRSRGRGSPRGARGSRRA